MTDITFPSVINTERQLGTNHVRLIFEGADGTGSRTVLKQEQLMSLIALLHEQIELAPLAPVSLDRLRPGQGIKVMGTSIRREPDGSLRIVLTADLEDRVVTIPFTLDPEGVAELRSKIGRD